MNGRGGTEGRWLDEGRAEGWIEGGVMYRGREINDLRCKSGETDCV